MCVCTTPAPPGPSHRVSILGACRVSNFYFFRVFFQHSPRTPKNRLNFAPRGLLSQLVRFWTPTWPPKRTQNPHFFGSKRQLMLKRAKTQNLMRVLHLEHIFASPGRPKTHQKSMKNRSQEASMLRSFSNTHSKLPRGLPGTLLERIF